MKDQRPYLRRILKSLDRIQEEAQKGELTYRSSETVQESILMNLAVIGENVKALPDGTVLQAPDVPWREIARLRDMIIHRYHNIDLNEIWDIVRLDILPFRSRIEGLLQALGSQDAAGVDPDA